jgi:Tol biopolymer transport system component
VRGWKVLILACLASANAADPTLQPRQVWAAPDTNLLGAPSPDGRFLSYADPATGSLALFDVAARRSRVLVPGKSGEFAYFSTVSRDGKQVAYAWFNQEKFYELRAVSVIGGEPALLFRNEEAGFVQPCAWSPDGKQILTLLFRKDNISQIVLIDSAPPHRFHVLKSLNWVYPNKMDFSPDGRFVVYDNPAPGQDALRDLFVLAVDGSRESRVVTSPANDIFPVWSPDGKAVVFVSDRTGKPGIWRQPVMDGKPAGEAVLLKADVGRVLAMGMTREGDFFYGLRAGATDVKIAEIDLATGQLASQPTAVASKNLAGTTSAPAWSRDGTRLAFLVRLANENFGQDSYGIGITGPDGGRVLMPTLAHMERLEWSPDNEELLVSGSDRQNRRGLYRVNVGNGNLSPLVQQRSSTYHGFEGVWTEEGRAILYAADGEVRKRGLRDAAEKVLYRPDALSELRHLVLSPNQRWLGLVERANTPDAPSQVRAVDTQAGSSRLLASVRSGEILGLEWTHDSGALLVSAPGDRAPALWRASIEAGNPTRLSTTFERRDGIRLHPNGNRIAFTVGEIRPEVWVLEAQRSGERGTKE